MAGVLAGVRVLDISRVVSGPWCTQVLADLGAEVIKVERAGPGDDTRSMGPFLPDAENQPTNDSAIFMACNRGKRSITLDLASEEGARIVRELAATCDVFVENFKAGTLGKYGLDYEGIRAARPDIVYCSITGFGHDGPYAARPAYDFVMQALSGLMSTNGQPEGAPGSSPLRTAIPLTDMVTGLYAAIAILAALMHRRESGEGQFIDAAMLDSAVALNANLAVGFLMNGKVPKRSGNTNAVVAPSDSFETSDGSVIIAVSNDAQFRAFAALIDAPELADDPRFVNNTERFARRYELRDIIQPLLKPMPTAYWVARCAKANVPCGPINHMHEVFADAQVRHRRLAIALPHGSGQDVRLVRSPINLSKTPVEHRAPPRLGQDTDDVLAELGRSPEQIAALREKKIV
ncbi:MAG: CaiB/BaiF CoA-transferase family protein [Beijerinckiaceae bacterium]